MFDLNDDMGSGKVMNENINCHKVHQNCKKETCKRKNPKEKKKIVARRLMRSFNPAMKFLFFILCMNLIWKKKCFFLELFVFNVFTQDFFLETEPYKQKMCPCFSVNETFLFLGWCLKRHHWVLLIFFPGFLCFCVSSLVCLHLPPPPLQGCFNAMHKLRTNFTPHYLGFKYRQTLTVQIQPNSQPV